MITAMPRIAIAMDDYPAAVEMFRDVFGMPVVDFGEAASDLGAHVGMCMPPGGSMIELMSPANPELPLSQALDRFLDRRGNGFYALMLEAPDPNAEAEELAHRGMDVLPLMAGAGGRDIHPRSTHGVLTRVYPDGSVKNPGNLKSGEPNLSGIARAIIATQDVHTAVKAYGAGLGLDVGPVEVDADRGVTRALVSPAAGGQIELVSVADHTRPFAGKIAAAIAESGEGIYALVLTSADPTGAFDHLRANGVQVIDDAAMVFGARILIEAS